jgi:glyoxylase-like metal-dependent hydrolase (beta-lactamase superfamily II)
MRLHVFRGGIVRINKGVFTPGRGEGTTLDSPMPFYVIRHAKGILLIDTGAHPDVMKDPIARWGGLAKAFVPVMQPGEDVVGSLKAIGLEPQDVDLVVNSHLHMDHAGGNEFFRHCPVYVHEREMAWAKEPSVEGKGYYRADWDHPLDYRPLRDEWDAFGDGRVVFFESFGHTPGHMAAVLRLERTGTVVLACDTIPLLENLDAPDLVPRNAWQAEPLRASIEVLRGWRDRGAIVISGHDPAQWATLRAGVASYD